MTTTVQIKAIRPKFEKAPVFIAPQWDEARMEFIVDGKRYKARHQIHPKEGDQFICDDTPIRLILGEMLPFQHGMSFDRSEEGRFRLAIGLDAGVVVKNIGSINPSESIQRFYVMDEEENARNVSSRAEFVMEALGLIKDMTASEKLRFAFFRRKNARMMTDAMVDAFIKELALNHPEEVIKGLTSEKWKVQAFLQQAVQYGILRSDGEIYKLKDTVIGISEDAAIAYLEDRSNAEVVNQIKASITEAKKKAK